MATDIPASESARRLERKPFYNEEAERGVLGSILLDSQAMDFALESQLELDSFYVRAHQVVFAAMGELSKAGRPIDVLTLAERLRQGGTLDDIGGPPFLRRLVESTPTAAHAGYYIDIVRQIFLRRRIAECARAAENECYASDAESDQLLGQIEQSFFDITEGRHGTMVPWEQAVTSTMAVISTIVDTHQGLSGLPTGYKDLDKKLHGLHKGEMIVIAARPGMGKTSLAMNIAEHVALGKNGQPPQPVGIFSLEMTREQLIMRLLGSRSEVPSHSILAGFLTNPQFARIVQAADVLRKAPIQLDDTSGLSILELRARARRMKRKHDVALFVIDYLQLVTAPDRQRDGRQNEVSYISQSIKGMAKELQVPVVVLCQLNRNPESKDRRGKPRIADLRESGAIEQDSDVVCLLYRPSKYTDEEGGEQAPADNLAILDVAKNRNGPPGEVALTFIPDLMRFEDCATPMQQE